MKWYHTATFYRQARHYTSIITAHCSSNLFNHLATPGHFTRGFCLACEQTSNRGLQPLIGDCKLGALCVLHVADEHGVCTLGLRFSLLARLVEIGGGALAAALRGLLLEETVDCVEL